METWVAIDSKIESVGPKPNDFWLRPNIQSIDLGHGCSKHFESINIRTRADCILYHPNVSRWSPTIHPSEQNVECGETINQTWRMTEKRSSTLSMIYYCYKLNVSTPFRASQRVNELWGSRCTSMWNNCEPNWWIRPRKLLRNKLPNICYRFLSWVIFCHEK